MIPAGNPIDIYVDADACPVKEEVYKVAQRYGLKIYLVSNGALLAPSSPLIERVIVEPGPDMADNWIADRVSPGDIVVTNDILLAERVLRAAAHVLAPNGKPFDRTSIGTAVGERALMAHLRSTGAVLGGPKPFTRNDRSRFLQALDQIVQRERRVRS